MTCRFDLDCFNTRRFKPYTGKMQVCANYPSESDRKGREEGSERETFSSASKLPHRLTCVGAHAASLLSLVSARRWPALIVLLLRSDMFGGGSALIRQHSFSHPRPLACALRRAPACPQTIHFHLDPNRRGKGKNKEQSPTGDFSDSSKLSEHLLYMAGKLIGPLPNLSLHPQCVSD